MNNGIIIWNKAGETIDRAYLEKVLGTNPNAVGIAVKHPKEGLVITKGTKVPSIDELMGMLEHAKDFEAGLWMAHIVEDQLKDKNLQPFVLKDPEGNPMMAVFIEGDFPKFTLPGTDTTEELNMLQKAIGPVLMDNMELAKGDFSNFLDRLSSETFEANVSGHIGHRGALVFFPKEGDPISIATNELGREFDWGATSQYLGYDPDAVKEQEPKKSSGWGFDFGAKAEETAPKAPEEQPVVPKNEPEVKPIKTETAIKPASVPEVKLKEEMKTIKVDPKLDGKARRRFIRNALGLKSNEQMPEGWHKKDYEIVVPISKLKDFKSAGEAIKSRSTVREAAPVQTKSDLPLVPVIKDEHKTKVMEFVVASLDANSKAIAGDPKTISKIESMFPTFSEATGVQLEDIFKLSYEQRLELTKTYPDMFALLQMETEAKYRDLLKAEAPKTSEEPVKTEEPKKVEAQPEAPAEEKKVAAGGKKKWSW